MASDPSIYNLVGQGVTPLLSPLEVQLRKLQMRNALAAGTLQDQQIQQGALGLKQAQSDYDANEQYKKLFAPAAPAAAAQAGPAVAPSSALPTLPDGSALPGAPAFTPPASAPPLGTPAAGSGAPPSQAHDIPDDQLQAIFGTKAIPLIHARNEATKLAADAAEGMSKVRTANTNYWGSLAYGIAQSGFDPGVIQASLAMAKANGMERTPEFQLFAANAQNPDAVKQLAARAMAASPEQQTLLNERTTSTAKASEAKNASDRLAAELPKITADGKLATLTAAGQAPIQPAEQAHLGIEKTNSIETARHNRVEESNAASNREAINLTPAARDQMATMFATTGTLPNLGMGAAVAATRSSIINRAAELYPTVSFASNAAAYQANKHSLNNVTGALDTLTAFEGAGLKNLKMFTDAAAKIPDTGVPWLNLPVRMLDEKLVGSKNMSVVNAARDVALREIARVTNDPKLSGVLSDSARAEVQSLSPKNATLPQILAVAKVLQTDMANVHQSLQEQKDAIGSRLAASPAGATATNTPAEAPKTDGVQQFKAGDTVMYQGQPHKVLGYSANGKLQLSDGAQ